MLDPRYGAPIGDWTKLVTEASANMNAPATSREVAASNGRRVEWIWKKPASVTAYTVHWGRWVVLAPGLEKWVEIGREAVASASSSETWEQVDSHEVNGDKVGIYVDGITGSPASAMQFWFRVLT